MAKKSKQFFTVDELKRDILKIATDAFENDLSFGIGKNEDRLLYSFAGANSVAPKALLQAVPIELDDLRKSWMDILALVRIRNLSFVYMSRTKKLAFLSRHPTFKVNRIQRYIDCFDQNTRYLEKMFENEKRNSRTR